MVFVLVCGDNNDLVEIGFGFGFGFGCGCLLWLF